MKSKLVQRLLRALIALVGAGIGAGAGRHGGIAVAYLYQPGIPRPGCGRWW